MAKKKVYIVEYRYDTGHWNEYARTSVQAILSTYVENCYKDYPGADVRYRPYV